MSRIDSVAMEASLLAAVVMDSRAFHDVAELVTEECFTVGLHRRAWVAIRSMMLAGDAVDAITVMEVLQQHSERDASDFLGFVANTLGVPQNVRHYACAVREAWQRREAVGIAQRLMSACHASEDGAVEVAIGELLDLCNTKRECEFTGDQLLQMAVSEVDAAVANGGRLPGITTGMKTLDALLGGWHRSDLTIIGARPAMGKTALMVCLAEAAAATGVTVGVFSAEQPGVQIGMRRLALASGVGASAMRSGDVDEHQWPKIVEGVKKARAHHMRVYDRSALTLDELVAVARKWKHSYGIAALFVDYAQRIKVPGADRITEVSQVAMGLKNLARDLDIPVIALAQVKAAVETRPNKRPGAGDLANSDELTREADQILMLYRDEVYAARENRETRTGIAEILVEKNRHGPTGFVELAFMAETMRFADLAKVVEDF